MLSILVEIFSKELRNSYLTTVVEQEINNTVMMNQELSKRCIWLQMTKDVESDLASELLEENSRRLSILNSDLKVGPDRRLKKHLRY